MDNALKYKCKLPQVQPDYMGSDYENSSLKNTLYGQDSRLNITQL